MTFYTDRYLLVARDIDRKRQASAAVPLVQALARDIAVEATLFAAMLAPDGQFDQQHTSIDLPFAQPITLQLWQGTLAEGQRMASEGKAISSTLSSRLRSSRQTDCRFAAPGDPARPAQYVGTTDSREFFRLLKENYWYFPTDQTSNADWEFLASISLDPLKQGYLPI